MQKKYKVLHIFSGYGGGISSLIFNLIENKTEEFQMDLMAFDYKGGQEFIKQLSAIGAECYTMPRPTEKGYESFVKYLDDLMKNEKYDAIHCHIAGIHAIPFEHIAKKNRIKVFVLHAHTTCFDSKLDRCKCAYYIGQYLNYKNSSCYMTCSDMAANYVYGERYLKRRNAYLIPNGIKKESYQQVLLHEEKESYKKEFGINEGTIVVLHVGRFSPQKNHDFILKIASTLKEKKNNFIFLLIGDGSSFDTIKNKVYTLGLEKQVRLLGRRSDISKLMQFADCMILPSLYEGLPTVAIECQSSGTKILVSDKITKQCDMGLNLVDFLPIDEVNPWVSELKKNEFPHLPVEKCINAVEEKGFTAASAGKHYCDVLKKCING